jgi:hypothetical protein
MNIETGTRLRSLYESAGGVATIFSPKVADYVSSRRTTPRLSLKCSKARATFGVDCIPQTVTG